MTIIAKTHTGTEYLYSASSAFSVSKRSAKEICRTLNAHRYRLNNGETWHVYEIDQYDAAYTVAQNQRCTIRKGMVKIYSAYGL